MPRVLIEDRFLPLAAEANPDVGEPAINLARFASASPRL
jgi:hypothetical protein